MSALAILAVVALTVLLACVVLARIPYGAEDPVPGSSADEGARPHRDYLLSRGWRVDEDLEAGRPDAPVVAAWSRREDGLGPHTCADALLL